MDHKPSEQGLDKYSDVCDTTRMSYKYYHVSLYWYIWCTHLEKS